MIDEVYLNIIVVMHFIFVLFVVLVPFVGNNYFLILHSVAVPFMMAHWYMNDNNCALTLMEKKLRKVINNGQEPDPADCFTYNLIAPVYDFKKNYSEFSILIYGITISLWFYSMYRLYDNWKNGKLQRLEHLMMF